jgi:hypothetical protein
VSAHFGWLVGPVVTEEADLQATASSDIAAIATADSPARERGGLRVIRPPQSPVRAVHTARQSADRSPTVFSCSDEDFASEENRERDQRYVPVAFVERPYEAACSRDNAAEVGRPIFACSFSRLDHISSRLVVYDLPLHRYGK